MLKRLTPVGAGRVVGQNVVAVEKALPRPGRPGDVVSVSGALDVQAVGVHVGGHARGVLEDELVRVAARHSDEGAGPRAARRDVAHEAVSVRRTVLAELEGGLVGVRPLQLARVRGLRGDGKEEGGEEESHDGRGFATRLKPRKIQRFA